MKMKLVGVALLCLSMKPSLSFAQEAPDMFQGYEGKRNHVFEQLIALSRSDGISVGLCLPIRD